MLEGVKGVTEIPKLVIDESVLKVAEEFGLLKDGSFPYEIKEANGLRFICDPEKPRLGAGEMPAYPFHDEAEDLLAVATKVFEKRERSFALCVDSFCGGGHSGLPVLRAGIAQRLIGHDVNTRAITLARANAKLNGIANAEFSIGSVTDIVEPSESNTLYIANPPFAIRARGASMEIMRDGGENALALWEAFMQKAVPALQADDVICSVFQSRIGTDGHIEAEDVARKLAARSGITDISISLISDRKLWRGFNGLKEQNNPMPLSQMPVKADPSKPEDVALWQDEAERQIQAGYDRLGYFSVVVQK